MVIVLVVLVVAGLGFFVWKQNQPTAPAKGKGGAGTKKTPKAQ